MVLDSHICGHFCWWCFTFLKWNKGFLVLGAQFAGGVVLGTAMMHFLNDANETFEDLTLQKRTLRHSCWLELDTCWPWLLIVWSPLCLEATKRLVISSFFFFSFLFFFLFFFLFGILAKFQLMLMNGMLILKVEALGIGEIYELIVLVKYTGSD